MKILPCSSNRPSSGYALVLVLTFLGISLVILSGALKWTSTSALVTQRRNQYSSSLAVAEAATETVIARMVRDFQYQGVNTNLSVYRVLTPGAFVTNGWAGNYEFTDAQGNANQTFVTSTGPSAMTNLNSQFAGLYGLVSPYRVVSNAREKNTPYDIVAAVKQDFQLALIPIFQFAIFYSIDLEICPGPVMTVTGKVHGNADLYVAPVNGLQFNDAVTAVGNIYTHRDPDDPQAAFATSVPPVYQAQHKAHVSALTLPIGTNNSPTEVRRILDVPPAGEDPRSPMGKQRYFNKTDLIVQVSDSGVAVRTGQWNTFVLVPYNSTNGYSFVRTNISFFDTRENKWTLGTELDVAALRLWMSSAGASFNAQAVSKMGHQLNSVYVDDGRSRAGKLTVVRVVNGQILPPSGLTVATKLPLYVKGHFNAPNTTPGLTDTSATRPSSLVGDAITVLSPNWSDANSNKSLNQRGAASGTVNAAFLSGIVQSTHVGAQKYYSGGVENFPRFLEDWDGKTLTYNGSMVVMFESQYGKTFWQQPGNYYNPPVRKWAFDLNFLDPRKLPPGTPQVEKLVRGQWEVVAANTVN